MDESWRMQMGSSGVAHRRSTETPLDPNDFADVFGGPPRTVLNRRFSADFAPRQSSSCNSFYHDVFSPSDTGTKNRKSGRKLPAFRIPATKEDFYGDVFGWDDDERRSRDRSHTDSKEKSKSKSSSSSVLSYEDLSPLQRGIGDDMAFSSFASKLRPVNVPIRWNSTTKMAEDKPCNPPSMIESQSVNFKNKYYGFSKRNCSPETTSMNPSSCRSSKVSGVDDVELNSPASIVSSLCQETKSIGDDDDDDDDEDDSKMQEQQMDEDEDEVTSSYVIEVNSVHRETASHESVLVDEAIAWAKESFQSITRKDQDQLGGDGISNHELFDEQMDEQLVKNTNMEEQNEWSGVDGEKQSENNQLQMEMELIDEDIRLWSAGRETNIQLLLSTLHHVLWPSSGWSPISLTSLLESSQVKKAYQKVRLCLHPDKLQQRGATLTQRYVAEKAFSILQDAWAILMSQQDVYFS